MKKKFLKFLLCNLKKYIKFYRDCMNKRIRFQLYTVTTFNVSAKSFSC